SPDELVARLGIAGDWRANPGRLGDHLRRDLRGAKMLVFVDQAEQLVAWPAVDRERFLAALLAAADDPDGPLRGILAVRHDFVIELAQTAALRESVGRHLMLLGPPDGDQLTAALIEPARRLGFELEPGLADEIVGALRVTDPGERTEAPYRT